MYKYCNFTFNLVYILHGDNNPGLKIMKTEIHNIKQFFWQKTYYKVTSYNII